MMWGEGQTRCVVPSPPGERCAVTRCRHLSSGLWENLSFRSMYLLAKGTAFPGLTSQPPLGSLTTSSSFSPLSKVGGSAHGHVLTLALSRKFSMETRQLTLSPGLLSFPVLSSTLPAFYFFLELIETASPATSPMVELAGGRCRQGRGVQVIFQGWSKAWGGMQLTEELPLTKFPPRQHLSSQTLKNQIQRGSD